jgi:uncharacterized protein YutE (UPF0331/DUF86 family)
MDNDYFQAIIEHINECCEELNELNSILNKNKELTKFEYKAAERNLQILIESAIGFAKNLVRDYGLNTPNDAYQSFEKLAFEKYINQEELVIWKKIIGLRNALVHDYLNINKNIVKSILLNKHYLAVENFISKYKNK